MNAVFIRFFLQHSLLSLCFIEPTCLIETFYLFISPLFTTQPIPGDQRLASSRPVNSLEPFTSQSDLCQSYRLIFIVCVASQIRRSNCFSEQLCLQQNRLARSYPKLMDSGTWVTVLTNATKEFSGLRISAPWSSRYQQVNRRGYKPL